MYYFHFLAFQDDTYTESYISTIGVDFVSFKSKELCPRFLNNWFLWFCIRHCGVGVEFVFVLSRFVCLFRKSER